MSKRYSEEVRSDEGLFDRFNELLEEYASRTEAAQVASLTTRQLGLYANGHNEIWSMKLGSIMQLCRQAEISLGWLVYGRGDKFEHEQQTNVEVDTELLHIIIDAIEEGFLQAGKALKPERRADVYMGWYNFFRKLGIGVDQDNRDQVKAQVVDLLKKQESNG